MPFLGTLFTAFTFFCFWDNTYFFFFHANSHYVLKNIIKDRGKDIRNRGYEIYLWDREKQISVHKEEGCIISGYWSGIWDKKLNHFCYFLLK